MAVQTPDRVAAKTILRTLPEVDDVSLFGTSLHVRGTTGTSEALAERVRAAFAQGGAGQPAVDVQPIAPSLEDVFVLRSEAQERAS